MLEESHFGLPPPQTDPQSDWAFVTSIDGEIQRLWLSYALQRDFLSVPTSYTIVEISALADDFQLLQVAREEYLVQTGMTQLPAEAGLYQFPSDPPRLVFLSDSTVIEVVFEQLCQHPLEYHHASAQKALVTFLAR